MELHVPVEENISEYESPQQLGDLLVTLSMLPESRWRSLVNLDLIKVIGNVVFFSCHFQPGRSVLVLTKFSVVHQTSYKITWHKLRYIFSPSV